MTRRPIPDDVTDAFGEALVLLVQWKRGAEEPTAVLDGKTIPIGLIFELVRGRAFSAREHAGAFAVPSNAQITSDILPAGDFFNAIGQKRPTPERPPCLLPPAPDIAPVSLGADALHHETSRQAEGAGPDVVRRDPRRPGPEAGRRARQ
jgi:hypothetical protein